MHDQAASLRRKLAFTDNSKQAKTLCIISGKGGVGKSNIALNFSLELINKGKKVLLIDLDVGMGNIDILLGLHAEKTIFDMFHDFESIHDIIELGPKNLGFIAGGSGVSEFFSLDEEKKEHFYHQYNEVIRMYDYIIFDMGAGVSNESLFFILAADECIVVTTPEPTSITDAYSAIKFVINRERAMPISVIMNRVASLKDGERSLERFKQVVSQFLQVEVRKLGILPDDKSVSKAVIKQTPFILFDEKSKISKAMQELTYYYLSNAKARKTIEGSFIKRLKQLLLER
ncbi:cobyrinic acid a,c-diamide synthase [Oceanobacillus arenosus]|uniref:Cobyrinic acid a,c-diamide synthase n=1 Tax=Oceanobacillus arenosus TaxID=1229153 RepID=A0A3D8PTM1_9BACI|nr:MinD/ParA family protein [Oceanobacillus arenosus]RDW19500.1 cobyrinic acid a,c-diamide synthase [Oceanobacillus arenosus]